MCIKYLYELVSIESRITQQDIIQEDITLKDRLKPNREVQYLSPSDNDNRSLIAAGRRAGRDSGAPPPVWNRHSPHHSSSIYVGTRCRRMYHRTVNNDTTTNSKPPLFSCRRPSQLSWRALPTLNPLTIPPAVVNCESPLGTTAGILLVPLSSRVNGLTVTPRGKSESL